MNDSARKAFHEGFVPQLSTVALLALQTACINDDPHLIQGSTLLPPPLSFNAREPVECACAIAYAIWKGNYRGLALVAWVEEDFADICFEASALLGEPGGARHFLLWHDETDRAEMLLELTCEIAIALAARNMQLPAA
jgi:hypothetical protein